jgi:hypothetical protein
MTLLLAACQAQGDARAVEVVLRDDRGATVLTLTRTATGCVTDEALVIAATADRTSAGAWTFAAGPSGRELRGPAGLIARVVDEPGSPRRLSLIDAVGVPLARLTFDGTAVTITDAGRNPVGTIERAPGGARLITGEQVLGAVTGTDDLELAARLLVPAELPQEARALVACDRLATVTPAAK